MSSGGNGVSLSFSWLMARTEEFRLGRNDTLEGRLVHEGGLRVQGTLKGEAVVSSDIKIDPGAVLEARLEGDDVSVRGRVQGEIVARGRLFLGAGGALSGDVTVRRITIEDGATLNGRVTMPVAEQASQPEPEAGAAHHEEAQPQG